MTDKVHQKKKISKDGIEFNVTVSKNEDFWNLVNNDNWEPSTFDIFNRFIKNDTTFFDVGAWIGPTTLYGSQLAKYTYSFEPDPVAFKELSKNIDLNEELKTTLTILNKAVSFESGTLKLGSLGDGGDSMSSVLFADKDTAWEIESINLTKFIKEKEINGHLFVKIDIEGGEYEIVPHLKQLFQDYDIDLFLSIHPTFLEQELKEKYSFRFIRKYVFLKKHIKLLRSLPFKNLYSHSGRPLSIFKECLRSFKTGTFIDEIVASNKTWNK